MILHLFKKVELPKEIPEELKLILDKLKNIDSKEEYLQKVYNLFVVKYQGSHSFIFTKFKDLFINNAEKLVNLGKYQHCTAMNYLFRILLIGSGKFKEDDIKLAFSFIWYISPHQYLKINISDDKWINVDLWAKSYGIKFGNYAHGFNT